MDIGVTKIEMEVGVMDRRVKCKNLIGVLIAFIIAILSESSICPNTVYQKAFLCMLALVGIIYTMFFCKDKSEKKIIYTVFLFALPFIFASLYTFVYGCINGDPLGIRFQAFTTSMYIVIDILVVIGIFFVWKYESIKIISNAIIFSYGITVTVGIVKYGIRNLWLYITARNMYPDWYFSGTFERHDVGVAVVPLILFFSCEIISKKEWKNVEYWIRILLLLAILFLCGKRSAYIGLLSGILLLVVYMLVKNKKNILSYIIIGISLSASFLYVYLIKSGTLQNIFEILNINSMGRLTVYNWFSNQYKLSFFYFGKGFQYIHKYMISGLGSELVNKFGYLHNSILQIYIEMGFIGFWIWLGIWMVLNPVVVKKIIGKSTARFYICLMVSMLAICTVDNVITYPLFQICMYMAVLQHSYEEKDDLYIKDVF